MSVSNEERRDAEKTGELVSKKLKEIMDLQADFRHSGIVESVGQAEGTHRVLHDPDDRRQRIDDAHSRADAGHHSAR